MDRAVLIAAPQDIQLHLTSFLATLSPALRSDSQIHIHSHDPTSVSATLEANSWRNIQSTHGVVGFSSL